MDKRYSLLGIPIHALTREEIVNLLVEFAAGVSARARSAFYVNAHCVNIACEDAEYRDILNKADLVYAGGQGIVWGARMLGMYFPERVNIMDFLDALAEKMRAAQTSLYLLGATQPVIKKAEQVLKAKGLRIVGARDGYFPIQDEPGIIKEINMLKPDILMVGMGVPKQEKWIYGHLPELRVNVCWGVGGAFDILAGRIKSAPRWINRSGLEWLYLGLQDPKRLLARYLLGNPLFVYRLLRHRIKTI